MVSNFFTLPRVNKWFKIFKNVFYYSLQRCCKQVEFAAPRDERDIKMKSVAKIWNKRAILGHVSRVHPNVIKNHDFCRSS